MVNSTESRVYSLIIQTQIYKQNKTQITERKTEQLNHINNYLLGEKYNSYFYKILLVRVLDTCSQMPIHLLTHLNLNKMVGRNKESINPKNKRSIKRKTAAKRFQ